MQAITNNNKYLIEHFMSGTIVQLKYRINKKSHLKL